MNNYAAAVVPFMLISRLDVATVAAAAVATRIWTLYCRVPQATLSAVGVFVGYSRGRSQRDAHAVVQRSRKYVMWPSFIAAAGVAATVPVFAKVFGGDEVDVGLVWGLTAAYLIAVPAYVVENLCGEILTVEQRAAWLSLPSTVVTYLVTIPMAIVGDLGMGISHRCCCLRSSGVASSSPEVQHADKAARLSDYRADLNGARGCIFQWASHPARHG